MSKDPMLQAKRYLLEQGVTEDQLAPLRAGLDAEIEAAIAQAESEPDPRPEDAMRHVYAEGQPLPDGTRA
jgi:TPP-dependent pyruvate/acetoin dehydrogenase alpha subunit